MNVKARVVGFAGGACERRGGFRGGDGLFAGRAGDLRASASGVYGQLLFAIGAIEDDVHKSGSNFRRHYSATFDDDQKKVSARDGFVIARPFFADAKAALFNSLASY